jgi:signal transduction histidine kinase
VLRRAEFFRLGSFRWPLINAGAFTIFTVVLFGFVYWQTATYLTMRIDGALDTELRVIASESLEQRRGSIDDRIRQDPRRVKLAGLFRADGGRIVGNLERLPPGIELDAPAREAVVMRVDERGRERQTARLVAHRMADGDVLVLGRNVDERAEIAEIVARALAIGIVPTLGLVILFGVALSRRAERRTAQLTRMAGRIVAGDLRERLPLHQVDDEFDRLARVINGMLDQIERLIHEISGVGDDIAHELRTPLTRVRATLERGRANAPTLEALQAVVDRAVGGLDQSLAIITALLRIAEIEHSRRLEGFGSVDLSGLVGEVTDLYEPIAEDREIQLLSAVTAATSVRGDRDLLFEAIANLVDNAIKFTPQGGRVSVTLLRRAGDVVVRIADSGPGIGAAERDAVTRRFYRSDKSRTTPGVGLGLTLVAAIAKLHGFALTIGDGPGGVVELTCPSRPAVGPTTGSSLADASRTA